MDSRPEPGPEVIYLRHVERARPHAPAGEEDRVYPPPQFIIPLRDAVQFEGGKVHFEARIEPVGDPSMRVEWFLNGRPLEASKYKSILGIITSCNIGWVELSREVIVKLWETNCGII